MRHIMGLKEADREPIDPSRSMPASATTTTRS